MSESRKVLVLDAIGRKWRRATFDSSSTSDAVCAYSFPPPTTAANCHPVTKQETAGLSPYAFLRAVEGRNRNRAQRCASIYSPGLSSARPHSGTAIMGLSKSTRIMILLGIDSAFFLLELVVGYAVHSLALVADSFHMVPRHNKPLLPQPQLTRDSSTMSFPCS